METSATAYWTQERSMVPRPIGTGFQLLEDLYGKHRHCTKEVMFFFIGRVEKMEFLEVLLGTYPQQSGLKLFDIPK